MHSDQPEYASLPSSPVLATHSARSTPADTPPLEESGTDTVLTPRFWRIASGVVEFLILLNVVVILSGILIFVWTVDRSGMPETLSLVDSAVWVSRQPASLPSRLCMLSGQIFFYTIGVLALWLYRGSQRWKWATGFFGLTAATLAVVIWKLKIVKPTVSTTGLLVGCLFLSTIGSAALLFSVWTLHIFHGRWQFKLPLLVGIVLLQCVFPVVFVCDKSGLAPVVVFITGMKLSAGSYASARVWMWWSRGENEQADLHGTAEETSGLLKYSTPKRVLSPSQEYLP